jgi:hypothetical protein
VGLTKGAADFRDQPGDDQGFVVLELFLLVEKNPVNGQEQNDRGDTQNVSAKQSENFTSDLDFE